MAHTAYIAMSDYQDTYKGTPIDTGSFERIAMRASEQLDEMTLYQVRRAGLASFDADVQESIKIATCILAESLAAVDAATDSSGLEVASEHVGPYSYTLAAGSTDKCLTDARTRAGGVLLFSGLLYRGV